jgi:hypothetical protein
MALSDEQNKRIDLIRRRFSGEIPEDEFLQFMGEAACPGNEEAQERYRRSLEDLLSSSLLAALENAAALPGVDVPVGPDETESN